MNWFSNYFKYGIIYFIPLFIISGIFSYAVYSKDANTFLAVMRNNEKQVMDFQDKMIRGHLKTLTEDINYISGLRRLHYYIDSDFNPNIDVSIFLSSFLKRREIYSSVRIIDSRGYERFRIDSDSGELIRTPEKKLQFKKNRYYFNDIMETSPDNIYLSRLDFNYENGAITIPYKPVLRVAKFIPNIPDGKKAFIILNYRGKDILDHIDEIALYSFGITYLINNDGWIVSLDDLMPKEKTEIINFLNSNQGKQFIQNYEGQLDRDSGLITHKKIRISEEPSSPVWDLISIVDKEKINMQTHDALLRGIIIFIILVILSIIFSFFALRNKLNRNKASLIINERARIFDFNPAPVIKTSAEGETISSNIAAKTILGLTSKPSSIYKVFDKLSDEEINHIDSDDIFNFEYQVGLNTYYFTSIRDISSSHVFFYGADITENYKIREDLKNFQTAVKQSANVIVFTDLEGHILFTNDAFETVTGYSSKEVFGHKTIVLNSGYHNRSFYKKLWDTINSGKVWAGEFYNKRKDGSFFWEKATVSPVLDNENNPRFFIAVKEDITEKKDIEAELKIQTQYAETARINAEKARIDAESANRHKSMFLANMSHEIRTPMNAILGFTRLLLDKDLHKNDREMLEIIMTSGENLLFLINDILDFSKIEANEIELHSVKLNLPFFFENIKDLFHIQIEQKNMEYVLSLSDRIPQIVFGDENRIRQILINIIGNAVKFTDSGSITVEADWIDNSLYIRVSDTGIGISEDKLEEIFSPFKQSDSSTDRKYEGTGLGLAISRKFIELMGGTVKVESKEGKGSTFIINIPLEECRETDQLLDNDQDKIIKYSDSRSIVEGWLNKTKDDEIITSILRNAIVSLPKQLKRLEIEIHNEQPEKLLALSHELMGNTGNLGMSEVYELLKEINTEIKSKGKDITNIEKIYGHLEKIIEGIPVEYLIEQASELLPIESNTIGINILTADDSTVNRKLIGAILSSININSDFAENGIEVLEKLNNKKYDMLLLDIQMPKMNGIETIKNIRNNDKYEDLYVIAVTANAMSGDAQKYLDSGCNDYISKPIEKNTFLKKIEYQIQRIRNSRTKKNTVLKETEILNIILLLEKEKKIFNPGRVKKIASKLEAFSSNMKIALIIKKLIESANSFDSKGLESIISELREMKENEN